MKKVLVVDDEKDMLWMLQRNLNRIPNVEAIAAKSGEEALAILSDTTINLVITDINMPGISGIDLLIEIKNLYQQTSVIIITAYPSNAYEQEAMMHGCLRFIEKPFDINEMKEVVEEVLFQDDSFQGTLGGVELLDVVQFNGMSRATSALKVTTEEREGMIFFKNGEVVHAMCGEEEGEDAFFTIIDFKGGTLQSIKGVEPPFESIKENLEALLFEAAARSDEAGNDEQMEDSLDLSVSVNGPASLSGEDIKRTEEIKEKEEHVKEEQISTTEDEEMTDIQKILGEFTNIDGVHTACLVGRDGFLLDSLARTGIDAEMIGAIASSGFGSAESMGDQLGQGNLTMTMIEYTEGPVLFAPVGEEAFLVIVADQETNLGWIRIAIKKNSSKIEKIASL